MSSPSALRAFSLSLKGAAWICLLCSFIIHIAGKKSRQLYSGNEYYSHYSWPRPQSQSFYFQSSTVSYGCVNGIIPPQGQEGVGVLE